MSTNRVSPSWSSLHQQIKKSAYQYKAWPFGRACVPRARTAMGFAAGNGAQMHRVGVCSFMVTAQPGSERESGAGLSYSPYVGGNLRHALSDSGPGVQA